jgi:hypothetical protein
MEDMKLKIKIGISENLGFLNGTIMAVVIIKIWLMPWMSWAEVVEYVWGILMRLIL